MIPKANDSDFLGRFREIISDPLNLLIDRSPTSGTTSDGMVVLHNGLKVPLDGPGSYYGAFSQILVINRGVHEPLEEFAFQVCLSVLPHNPVMIELGSYWSHYSMWLKHKNPQATPFMVEADPANLDAGKGNFARNGFVGEFIEAKVEPGGFEVDKFAQDHSLQKIDILHADIQGSEVEMLMGAAGSLGKRLIDYLFISTHSQELHRAVEARLTAIGYRVEISSDFDYQTTSYDGFVFASSPLKSPVFHGFKPLGRTDIVNCDYEELFASLGYIKDPSRNGNS